MEQWLGWLMIIIILTIIEVITTSLVSVWFIASAILALLVSFLTESFFWQFAVFVLGGTIFLVMTKPLLKRKAFTPKAKTNLERIIGMQAKVTDTITPNSIGEVYVDGKKWSAYSKETINVDEIVIVEAIDGVKLSVRKEK